MVSRATSLEGLVILTPFPKDKICCRQNEDVRVEFRRLRYLELKTTITHGTEQEAVSASAETAARAVQRATKGTVRRRGRGPSETPLAIKCRIDGVYPGACRTASACAHLHAHLHAGANVLLRLCRCWSQPGSLCVPSSGLAPTCYAQGKAQARRYFPSGLSDSKKSAGREARHGFALASLSIWWTQRSLSSLLPGLSYVSCASARESRAPASRRFKAYRIIPA
ncbi:hypothetical protein C8R47DRAFT_518325 [Mycena vitilis]|nr:hypothetical protein C8R47DRAFT_518325 [Mycena vitilis]